MNKKISIRKARKILKHACNCYEQMSDQLSAPERKRFEDELEKLDNAVKTGDKETAQKLAPDIEEFCKVRFKKSAFLHAKELTYALLFAAVVAICVRAMWFELYQIPSGSMRPTYQEQDHLSVSKTQFGINIPLMADHFYFDPDQVKRTGTIIFMGDNLPLEDASSWYWSRRYIKRLIGKPGDTVYFYGGRIYGIDKDGNPLNELLDSPNMQSLEHIPFLSFIGRPEQLRQGVVQIRQMHEPVGRVYLSPWGAKGEVFNGKEWVDDRPEALKEEHDTIQTYGDLWGINNYAVTRLITPAELKQNPNLAKLNLPSAPLYLEINHTPSFNRINEPLQTAIPLTQKHLDAIREHMYTTRFDVNEGLATPYRNGETFFRTNSVRLPGVENGRYQFDNGRAEKVGMTAILTVLPEGHPLNKQNVELLQKLYNYGLEWVVEPSMLPNRYAYFRDGDLYLLGAPIISKDDPVLKEYLLKEEQHEKQSKEYVAFKDSGAPLKNGELNKRLIQTFGLKIPEKHYLVLGDNHAISGDSRIMGFIPEGNLSGVPDTLLWPIGPRWPHPDKESPYPTLTGPRIFVWVVAAIAGIGFLIYYRRRHQQGYFKRK